MPSDEYFKAKSTGIADMSKAGAAEGLIARKENLARQENQRQQHMAAMARMPEEGRKFGQNMVWLVTKTFPVWSLLVVWIAGFGALFELGVLAGLAENVKSLPPWYSLPCVAAVGALVIYFRRAIRTSMKYLLLGVLALVLGTIALAFLGGAVTAIWERM